MSHGDGMGKSNIQTRISAPIKSKKFGIYNKFLRTKKMADAPVKGSGGSRTVQYDQWLAGNLFRSRMKTGPITSIDSPHQKLPWVGVGIAQRLLSVTLCGQSGGRVPRMRAGQKSRG